VLVAVVPHPAAVEPPEQTAAETVLSAAVCREQQTPVEVVEAQETLAPVETEGPVLLFCVTLTSLMI
jgi:hypothetical protein